MAKETDGWSKDRTRHVRVDLTPEEHVLARTAAAILDMPLSQFAAKAIAEMARQMLPPDATHYLRQAGGGELRFSWAAARAQEEKPTAEQAAAQQELEKELEKKPKRKKKERPPTRARASRGR